jgi:hypothetical protein
LYQENGTEVRYCHDKHGIHDTLPIHVIKQRKKVVARPQFQSLRLTSLQHNVLSDIFFHADGSLKRCVLADNLPRRKIMWIIDGIVLGKSTNSESKMRKRVLYLLKGFLTPDLETYGDMNFIIGGTKTQRLHHDVPREEGNNQDDYIKAMNSEVAPSSILIGMSKESKVITSGKFGL